MRLLVLYFALILCLKSFDGMMYVVVFKCPTFSPLLVCKH